MSTETKVLPVPQKILLDAGRSLVWIFDRFYAISDRGYAIVFGGVAIAFTFATFLMSVATGITEFQGIAGLAAALTMYICLEAVYDKHTYFVFVSAMVIPGVAAVTVSAITANLPIGYIIPVVLQAVLPYAIGLLVGMHLGEMFVKWCWQFFSLRWFDRARRDSAPEETEPAL